MFTFFPRTNTLLLGFHRYFSAQKTLDQTFLILSMITLIFILNPCVSPYKLWSSVVQLQLDWFLLCCCILQNMNRELNKQQCLSLGIFLITTLYNVTGLKYNDKHRKEYRSDNIYCCVFINSPRTLKERTANWKSDPRCPET